MNWRHILFLSCFTALLLLIVLDGRRNLVKATTGGSSEGNLKKKLFVQKLDASKFLKKQEKRSARSREERDERTHYRRREHENDSTAEDGCESSTCEKNTKYDEGYERDEYEYYDYD